MVDLSFFNISRHAEKPIVLKLVKALFAIADALLLLISPLAIIGFIVGAIAFSAAYGEHQSFVRNLTAHGIVTEAQLSSYEFGEPYIAVEFRDEDGVTRYGTIATEYYSEDTLLKLTRRERIRYLPEVYQSSFVLEDHFNTVKNYLGHLTVSISIMAISWIIVVIKPEFLYIGYDKSMDLALPLSTPPEAE